MDTKEPEHIINSNVLGTLTGAKAFDGMTPPGESEKEIKAPEGETRAAAVADSKPQENNLEESTERARTTLLKPNSIEAEPIGHERTMSENVSSTKVARHGALLHVESYLYRKNVIGRRFKNYFYLEEAKCRIVYSKKRSHFQGFNEADASGAKMSRGKLRNDLDRYASKTILDIGEKVNGVVQTLKQGRDPMGNKVEPSELQVPNLVQAWILEKHPKNAKKFRMYLGFGKDLTIHKFEAASEVERDDWLDALKASILFHLHSNFEVLSTGISERRSRSESIDFDFSREPSRTDYTPSDQMLQAVAGGKKGGKKGIFQKMIKRGGKSKKGLIPIQSYYNDDEKVKDPNSGGSGGEDGSMKRRALSSEDLKDMNLTQMADYLTGQENSFNSQLQLILQSQAELKARIKSLEVEAAAAQSGPLQKKVESVKEESLALTQHSTKLVEDVKLIRGNLHGMIERLAEKDLNSNLKDFLKRESVIFRGQGDEHRGSQKMGIAVEEDGTPNVVDEGDELFFSIMQSTQLPKRAQEYDSSDNEKGGDMDSDIDELFSDAIGDIQVAADRVHQSILEQSQAVVPIGQGTDDDDEPLTRDRLPWLKDPKLKVSMWAIVKDNIGKKELTQISMPVYFNEPFSLLQKICGATEYIDILNKAAACTDPAERLAYCSVYQATQTSGVERNPSKPFNPLLGETYEFENENIQFIAEQVSHHPPITASHSRGKKANFRIWTNAKMASKFTGKNLEIHQVYKTYIRFEDHNETIEMTAPVLSAHNLIIGTLYIDVGGTSKLRIIEKPEYETTIKYTRRGWLSKDEFKLEGDTVRLVPGQKKGEPLYQTRGNWNSKIFVAKYNGGKQPDPETETLVFEKNPYPDKYEYMYGNSTFNMNLNYFPKRLQKVVAPTDSRHRPDQRCLEEGNLIQAAKEKERLEVKQRKVRKYKEQNDIQHVPAYFVEEYNEHDDKTYWVYNNKYYEQDRKKQNWGHLPDLFSERLPFDEQN